MSNAQNIVGRTKNITICVHKNQKENRIGYKTPTMNHCNSKEMDRKDI